VTITIGLEAIYLMAILICRCIDRPMVGEAQKGDIDLINDDDDEIIHNGGDVRRVWVRTPS